MPPIKKRPKKKAIVPKKTKVDNFFDPPIAVKPKDRENPLTDLSVINEMARRLRSFGQWDNQLADSVKFLERRIRLMEEFHRYEGFAYEEVRRPFKSWEDCRKILVLIGASKHHTLSDFEVPIHCLLTAANCLMMWENGVNWGFSDKHIPIPEDIRTLPHGAIVIDWGKLGGVIIDRGGVEGSVPNRKRKT